MTPPQETYDGGRQLSRSLQKLTIGAVRDMQGRRVQKLTEGLVEREEQFVIAVDGRAGEFPAWNTVKVKFGITYVYGKAHRDSQLIRPHFVYGSTVESGGPVGLLACITKWDVTKADETTGCTLAIGAVATDQARRFRGELHARFQGYGVPTDVYGDMSSVDVG